jgi:transaldolase
MKAGLQQPPAVMQASVKAEVARVVEPLQASLKAANEKASKLEDTLFARDVDGIIEEAKREGFACEPMRASIVLVAKASGLEEAKKLAESAARVNVTAVGHGNGAASSADTVKASVTEYDKLVDARMKEGHTAAAAARFVNSTHPELAAKAFSAR